MSANTKPDHLADLLAGRYYHVFNRTNNRERLFRTDFDRQYFLRRYEDLLSPFVDTFAYCLLYNHFHFLVRVKPEAVIRQHLEGLSPFSLKKAQRKYLETPPEEDQLHALVSGQFGRLFMSYAAVYNERYNRYGNLFNRPFKRLEVQNEAHFTYLIFYIHHNPTRHKRSVDFTTYPWSSYQLLLSDLPTHLVRQEVLDWFGGREAFLAFHQEQADFRSIDSLIIEE